MDMPPILRTCVSCSLFAHNKEWAQSLMVSRGSLTESEAVLFMWDLGTSVFVRATSIQAPGQLGCISE